MPLPGCQYAVLAYRNSRTESVKGDVFDFDITLCGGNALSGRLRDNSLNRAMAGCERRCAGYCCGT